MTIQDFLTSLFPTDWVYVLAIVCPMVFLAGFVDSIAGGGGLLSLPAYMFAGLPIHFCLGTNKFAMMFGTSFSSFRFLKNKLVHIPVAIIAVLTALPGSWIGAQLAMTLDAIVMKGVMMVALPAVLIWMWVKRKKPISKQNDIADITPSENDHTELNKLLPVKSDIMQMNKLLPVESDIMQMNKLLPVKSDIVRNNPQLPKSVNRFIAKLPDRSVIIRASLIGFGIGAYDGLIGPGTGTFLILAFTALLGMKTLHASGTAKWVNLASNVAAFFTFLLHGQVLFWVGIPAALCAILGNWAGSHLAIKNGENIIRPLMGIVMILLLIKLGSEILI